MEICQSFRFNSSEIFSLEKVVGENILNWVPQSIADFARSQFHFVEGNFTQCKNLTNYPTECWQKLETTFTQNFKSAPNYLYQHLSEPKPPSEPINWSAKITWESSSLRKQTEWVELLCSKWTTDPEAHLKEIVYKQLEDSSPYQVYQKSNEIGLAILAIVSSALLGYGAYKIYKKYTAAPSSPKPTALHTELVSKKNPSVAQPANPIAIKNNATNHDIHDYQGNPEKPKEVSSKAPAKSRLPN